MEIKNPDSNIQFLSAGGEMGKLMREKDWGKTSLGSPQFWPQSLRTTLSIILNSKFPMFLFWGEDLICFYNDAYRPSLGQNGKHPFILGMKAEEAWAEIWHIIKPLIDQVLTGGEAIWSEDQLIPIYRNGKIEDVYWTFSYSPVNNESGKSAGVFVTCNETTDKIDTLKSLRESEERFRAMADNIPNLAWMAKADGWIYWYNQKWYEYTGTTPEQMEGWGWQSVHDPEELPRVMENWKSSVANGEEFEMVFPLKGADGNYAQFLTRVLPVKDKEGKIQKWFGSNTDITKQKETEEALKESKNQLEFAIEATELGTWDYNPLTNKFSSNERLKTWFGLSADEHIELIHAVNAMLESDRQKVTDAIQKALDFSSGGNYDIEYTIVHPVTKKETIVHAKGRAWFNDEKIAYRFNGTLEDITKQATAAKKVKESEERYHQLIYSSPSAIGILYGEDLIITIANDAIIKIWGKGKEIIGKAYFEALPELAEQGYKEVFARVYKTGEPFNAVETPVNILQNGKMERRYYNFILYPQRNTNNQIDGIGIIATEVTNQAEQNKKIEESEQRYRELSISLEEKVNQRTSELKRTNQTYEYAEQIGMFGSYRYNFSTQQISYSDNMYRILGCKPQEFPAHADNFMRFVHPDDLQFVLNATTEAFKHKHISKWEYRMIRKDGKTIHVRGTGKIIIDNEQEQWMIGTLQDITEEKQNLLKTLEISDNLKQSEERYHRMVEEVQDYAIILLSKDGIIENWNKGAEKIKGYKAEEIIGKHFSVFYAGEDRKNNLPETLLAKARQFGKATDESWRVRKDGSKFWGSIVITALHDNENNIIGYVKVTRDLTHRKDAEDKLKRNASELEQKNIDLEKMNKELQSFAYISSHDLQEPLRKIQTFATRIVETEKKILSETGKDYLKRMQDAALRMQTLIDDLLAYSRTNIADRKYENIDLHKIVNDVKEDLKEELQQKQATIEATELCEVNIIPFQFRQLLLNLLGNSLKFSDPARSPHIKIKSQIAEGTAFKNHKLEEGKKFCHISISDNGIGFEQQYSDKIFEVFQRLHGKTEYDGTGIGLAIVKKIVENHDGYITASSELNKGATFDIYIPAT